MFSSIKFYIYLAIIVASITAGSLFLYNWHYGVIKELKTQSTSLQNQLDETARQLNVCEANLSKQALQGYIDGIGENDENITIDLSNISY